MFVVCRRLFCYMIHWLFIGSNSKVLAWAQTQNPEYITSNHQGSPNACYPATHISVQSVLKSPWGDELFPSLCSRAGNYKGPPAMLLSRYLGDDTICIAILMYCDSILQFYCKVMFQTYCSLYVCCREMRKHEKICFDQSGN